MDVSCFFAKKIGLLPYQIGLSISIFSFSFSFNFNDKIRDIKECFSALSEDPDCRAIVLTGSGKHFTGGLDLRDAMHWGQQLAEIEDSARKGHFLEKKIKNYQVNIFLKKT